VREFCQVSHVKYIYIALFTIQIVSKLLHNINKNNLTVFVYSWGKKKTIMFGRAGHLIWISPTEQAKGKWQGTEQLHQVTRWCPKTPSDDPMEKEKNLGRTQAQSGASSPLAFMN